MGNNNRLKIISVMAIAIGVGLAGCNKNPAQTPAQDQASATDPAQANSATPSQLPDAGSPAAAPHVAAPLQSASTTQTAQSQPPPQASYPQESYPSTEQPQPVQEQAAPPANYEPTSYDTASYEQPIQVDQPPPPLPEYSQPPCPGDNYIWTPGYWGYSQAGYYWVPGVWVLAPYVGALWTPPYWGFGSGRYVWHAGYWGQHIGFYGGINYGFGYIGRGYEGGYWNRGAFAYNRSVTNVNTTIIHNVYNYKVVNITNMRVSYNGGRGGIEMRPIASEQAVLREHRMSPVPAQITHVRQAAVNREQFAANNHGHPQLLTANRPLETAYRTPAARPMAEPARQPVNAHPAPTPQQHARVTAPQPEARPAPAPHTEARPTPAPHAEARPAPEPRVEERAPAVHAEARPAPAPRPEPKSVPAPHAESRPVPTPHAEPAHAEPKPSPAPRAEERPAPHAHAEPQPAPKPAAKPAPEHENKHENERH